MTNQASMHSISQAKQNHDCMSVFQASQWKQDMKISEHSFIKNWKLSCVIILVATLDEQFKKFNSPHPWEQTAEQNVEKKPL